MDIRRYHDRYRFLRGDMPHGPAFAHWIEAVEFGQWLRQVHGTEPAHEPATFLDRAVRVWRAGRFTDSARPAP